MKDLEQLSNEDLEKLANNDLEGMSNEGLALISQVENKPSIEKQNIFGKVFNVPSAAMRSAIQGQGYTKGALNPSEVPSFQKVLSDKVNTGNIAFDMYLNTQANIAGAGLDYAADPAALLMTMAGAGVSKGLSKIGKAGRIAKSRVKDTSKGAKYAEGLREQFYKYKGDLIDEFGGQIDDLMAKNPTKRVNLDELAGKLLADGDELSSSTQSVLKGNPVLKEVYETPTANTQYTLKEIQDAINYLNNKITKVNKNEVINIIHNLKAKSLDAFPEMANVRANYATKIQPWKDVKSKFNSELHA